MAKPKTLNAVEEAAAKAVYLGAGHDLGEHLMWGYCRGCVDVARRVLAAAEAAQSSTSGERDV